MGLGRRMFSDVVVGADIFSEIPHSSQMCYIRLGMAVDDEGFVNYKKILRVYQFKDSDIEILVAIKYIILFDKGICILRHHLINNNLRSDFFKPSIFMEQRRQVRFTVSKVYYLLDEIYPKGEVIITEPIFEISAENLFKPRETKVKKRIRNVSNSDTNRIQSVYEPDTKSIPPVYESDTERIRDVSFRDTSLIPIVYVPDTNKLINKEIKEETNRELSLSEIEAEKEKIRRRMTEF